MSKKNIKKNPIVQNNRQKEELVQMKKLDNTSLKEQVFQLREQLNYLLKQKNQLEQQMSKGNDKYMRESFQIEKIVKVQEQQLTDLENNYKIMKSTFEDYQKKVKIQWNNEQEMAERKKNAEKEAITKNITLLQNKIKHIRNFNTREADYIATLQKLNEKQVVNKMQQTKDIENIVNEHLTHRKQIQTHVEKEIQHIRQSQVNKLQQKMNREQQIKKQNQIIEEEIALCLSEKDLLEKEYLEAIRQNQANCAQNPQQLLQGQASQTYERSLRVIKLQQKLGKLREFFQTQIKRLQTQYKKTENQLQSNRRQAQENVAKLENWLKLKEKDLKKMKACAQMVLNQRSNLQSYLLQVFHQNPTVDYHDPANINSILRNLFIKINSRRPPQSYKDHLIQKSRLTEQSRY